MAEAHGETVRRHVYTSIITQGHRNIKTKVSNNRLTKTDFSN